MSILKNITKGSLFAGLAEHKPEIFMGVSFGLAVMACVVTHKQTIKAEEALRKEKERISEEKDIPVEEVKLTPMETMQVTGVYYALPGAIICVSGACLYLAAKEGQRKLMAATAACMMSEDRMKELEDKTKDILGIKHEEEEAREEIRKNPPSEENIHHPETVVKTVKKTDEDGGTTEVQYVGPGDVMFFETLTSQYFMSDILTVKDALLGIKSQLNDELEVELNDYLWDIGAKAVDDEYSKNVKWRAENGFDVDLVPVIENGRLIVNLIHRIKPCDQY